MLIEAKQKMGMAWSISSGGERGEEVRVFAAGRPSLCVGSLAPVNASNTQFSVSGSAAGSRRGARSQIPSAIARPVLLPDPLTCAWVFSNQGEMKDKSET